MPRQSALTVSLEIVDVLRLGVLAVLLVRLGRPLLWPRSELTAHGEDDTPPIRRDAPLVFAGVTRLAYHPLVLCALAMVLFFCASRVDHAMFTDEGLWNYIAIAWLKYHLPPYIGTVENKTPGIFYLFALSYHFFGLNVWFPRLVGVVASTVTCAAIYHIGKLLFDRLAGLLALLIFALLMTTGLVDGGYTAMTETFMVVLLHAGDPHAAAWRGARHGFAIYLALVLLAGALLGAAIAFKQIAITTAVAAVIWLLLSPSPHKRGGVAALRDLLLLAGGICARHAAEPAALTASTMSPWWIIFAGPG